MEGGGCLSADNAQRLEELLAAEIPRWREGFACGHRKGHGVDELHPLPDASLEENFMRFTGFGIVNSHSVVGDDTGPYPKVSGAQRFKVDRETKMLVAEWCIESKWYNQPTLHNFPFDSHEMCAIFWTQTWPQLRIAQFGRSYGLGTFLQEGAEQQAAAEWWKRMEEFEVLGFRGDPKPLPGWDPYVCESNIVPNLGRPAGEYMVYARFWIRRRPFYFITSLLFPTGVVTAMGGFAIMVAAGASPNSIVIGGESPLSLVAGLILTMMAMQFSYADSLPKLCYLTMLDIYIFSSFCLLSSAACVITLLPAESLLDWHMSHVFFTICLTFNAIWAAVGWKDYHIPEEKKPELTFANAAESLRSMSCIPSCVRNPERRVELSWEKVVQQERGLINRKHREGRRNRHAPRFSIAFSGGGVRAAAFQAGVLWRLAEAGRWESVDHLVAVSGGAYIASAFASTVLNATTPSDSSDEEPSPGCGLNDFYLRCAAKTICRMQRNVSYLIRDLRPGHFWDIATDGSSVFPPILDLLVLLIMVVTSMIINPLTVLTLYVLPFAEGVDLFDGASMRAAYCVWEVEDAVKIFSNWGPLQSSVLTLCISVFAAFFLWCISLAPPLRVHEGWPVPRVAQTMLSLRAVVSRASVVQLLILGIVTGAFIAQLDGNPNRREQCDRYIRSHMSFVDSHVIMDATCHDYYSGYPWWTSSYFTKYFSEPEKAAMNSSMLGLEMYRAKVDAEELEPEKSKIAFVIVHLNQVLMSLQNDIITRVSRNFGFTSVGAFLALGLFVALMLNPLISGLFLWTLSLLGPVIALFVVGSLVQFRIYGPVTNQSYAWGLSPWPPLERWRHFVICMFACILAEVRNL
eukprot:s288_g33.t2